MRPLILHKLPLFPFVLCHCLCFNFIYLFLTLFLFHLILLDILLLLFCIYLFIDFYSCIVLTTCTVKHFVAAVVVLKGYINKVELS